MSLVFNKHRLLALFLLTIAAIMGWYALILLTNPVERASKPDCNQWIALFITVLLAVGGWLSQCLTIIPY